MSDAPEVSPASAKNPEQHPLDVLTGGAFSAETSGDRASRIRDWLATQPSVEQLQDVLKELSARDKSAARAVRERLDEIRRTKDQRATLVGLGLNKMHKVSELQDSPEVRGMIRKVQHMVQVVD